MCRTARPILVLLVSLHKPYPLPGMSHIQVSTPPCVMPHLKGCACLSRPTHLCPCIHAGLGWCRRMEETVLDQDTLPTTTPSATTRMTQEPGPTVQGEGFSRCEEGCHILCLTRMVVWEQLEQPTPYTTPAAVNCETQYPTARHACGTSLHVLPHPSSTWRPRFQIMPCQTQSIHLRNTLPHQTVRLRPCPTQLQTCRQPCQVRAGEFAHALPAKEPSQAHAA